MREWRDRAKPISPGFPCCWVCGQSNPPPEPVKPAILRLAGYRVGTSLRPWAHSACMVRAHRSHREHEFQCARRQQEEQIKEERANGH